MNNYVKYLSYSINDHLYYFMTMKTKEEDIKLRKFEEQRKRKNDIRNSHKWSSGNTNSLIFLYSEFNFFWDGKLFFAFIKKKKICMHKESICTGSICF